VLKSTANTTIHHDNEAKHVSKAIVRLHVTGGGTPKFLGGPNPSLHLSPSFPFTFSSLFPVSPSPLEVGPLDRDRELGAL